MHALDTESWEWDQLPDLNFARYLHSSTSLGRAVYVACGVGNREEYLNSVERLEMGGTGSAETQQQAWSLIETPEITPRRYPVFSQISPDELCILGGGFAG